jgi:hypothetical protein
MLYKTMVLELLQQHPEIHDRLRSAALEVALRELAYYLDSGSPPDPDQPLSLEEVMAFLRCHTPPE